MAFAFVQEPVALPEFYNPRTWVYLLISFKEPALGAIDLRYNLNTKIV